MAVTARAYTWDDIKDWPETAKKIEIVHGDLVVSAVPGTAHGTANSEVALALANHIDDNDLGRFFVAPMDTVLATDVVYQPDLCFVHRDRLDIIQHTHIAGPPDLTVEIISESNRSHDIVVKFADYARYRSQRILAGGQPRAVDQHLYALR